MGSAARRASILCAVASALIASVAIGFAHTEAGRPWLATLRSASGCPVALGGGNAATLEAYRVAQLAKRRGRTSENARPALTFELGQTRRGEVIAALGSHAETCEARSQGSVLRCRTIPQALQDARAPRIDDLHLQFDPAERLAALDLWRVGTNGSGALSWIDALAEEFTRKVGEASAHRGQHSARYLDAGELHQRVIEYRYESYLARVSATNLGARGVRIREQYQWLPAGSEQ